MRGNLLLRKHGNGGNIYGYLAGDAVVAANNAATDDTINFAAGLTNITLDNASITIADNGTLTIDGSGANVLTIDGGAGQNRIFLSTKMRLRLLRT